MKGGRELRRPQSPASRQIDINENERRTSIVEKSQGLGAVWSGADLQPEGRQMPRKGHAEQGVLVDDKDAIIGVRAQQSPPREDIIPTQTTNKNVRNTEFGSICTSFCSVTWTKREPFVYKLHILSARAQTVSFICRARGDRGGRAVGETVPLRQAKSHRVSHGTQ